MVVLPPDPVKPIRIDVAFTVLVPLAESVKSPSALPAEAVGSIPSRKLETSMVTEEAPEKSTVPLALAEVRRPMSKFPSPLPIMTSPPMTVRAAVAF